MSNCSAKSLLRAKLRFSNIYLKRGRYAFILVLARQYYWYISCNPTSTWSLEKVWMKIKTNHSLSLSLLLSTSQVNIFLLYRRTYWHSTMFLEVLLCPHLFMLSSESVVPGITFFSPVLSGIATNATNWVKRH